MKALRLSLFTYFTFFIAINAFAQPSIGISLGMTKHFGETFIGLNPTGRINVHTTIRFKDKLIGKFGAAYTFMAKDITSFTVNPKYPGIAPVKDANYTFKMHGPSIFAQTRYYVVNDYYGPINLYIPAEVALHVLFAEGSFERLNPSLYDYPDWYDGPQKDLLIGYSIGAGIGAEFQIGVPFLFLESQFVFPVNKVNGQYVEPKVPMHIVFDAGLRLPLSGNYHAKYRRRRR